MGAVPGVPGTGSEIGPEGGYEGAYGEDRLLSVLQVAALMQVSRNSVYRLIEAGRLPCVRVGRALRVPEGAVDTYLRQTLPSELA